MRALSDALPTGHRAMTNPTLQLHFGCGRATPPVSHSHNWPSRRMQNFLFKIGQKSYFFANKDPQTNFDDWMILQKHVLSFQCNTFFKMANLKAISSSATLTIKWLGHFFLKMWFHFLMLFTLCAIFLNETGPIQWMFSQHCGYWWPGASAPGHQ